MSITDELREYAQIAFDKGSAGRARVETIADRIDAEHEADVSTACRLAAGLDNDALSKRGYIALPVDADGVPIRVGDRLEHVNGAFTANDMTVSIDGLWRAWDGENGHTVLLSKCLHHATTVEDVLREFARELDADAYGITDAKVAEFAAKLRLAGEDE